jgi:hypothetical protein
VPGTVLIDIFRLEPEVLQKSKEQPNTDIYPCFYPGNFAYLLEISVKSGKDSTSALSLVIHRVRFLKYLQKKYISIQRGGGVKLRKPSILIVPEFHPVFLFFPSASTAAT